MSIAPAAKEATPKSKPKRPDLDAELNNLAMSKESQPLYDAVVRHIEENVAPITEEFFKLGEGRKDRWSWAPGQLETEIQDNGWLHCPADPDLIFGRDIEDKYARALHKIGIDPGMLSTEAGHA